MIRVPRAFVRMTCLILWVPAMYAIRLASMPIRIFSKPADAQARRTVLRLFSKGVLAILGMRVDVRGRPPAMPYLLVSNHLAGVDIFVLGSLLGPVFISQGDVANWPLVGLVARAGDTIFIDRTRLKDIVRVNQLIADKLRDGEGIVFFPESTTSEDGILLPFKTAHRFGKRHPLGLQRGPFGLKLRALGDEHRLLPFQTTHRFGKYGPLGL